MADSCKDDMRGLLALILGVTAGIIAVVTYKLNVDIIAAEGINVGHTSENRNSRRSSHSSVREEVVHRHSQYLVERSRDRWIALEEIVSVYYRADPAECIKLLTQLNAASLLSSQTVKGLLSDTLPDFSEALRLASEYPGRRGDRLICEAFRKQVAEDPREAIELLRFLPKYLVEELASELASTWGAKDGAKAAEAFLGCRSVLSGSTQFKEVMRAWAERSPEEAFRFLQESPLLNPPLSRDDFLYGLSLSHPKEAAKHGIFSSLLKTDPRRALEVAAGTQDDYPRNKQLQAAVNALLKSDPGTAFQNALELPISERSLFLVQEAAKNIAKTSGQGAFAVATRQSDQYKRTAAIKGVTEGFYQAKGAAGIVETVREGVSSGNREWLESVSSLILSGSPGEITLQELSMRITAGNEHITFPDKTQSSNAPDWKTLPADTKSALIQFGENQLSSDVAAKLKQALQ